MNFISEKILKLKEISGRSVRRITSRKLERENSTQRLGYHRKHRGFPGQDCSEAETKDHSSIDN